MSETFVVPGDFYYGVLDKYLPGRHGRVLPGNSRARNRSRSRRRKAWKAPTKLRYLEVVIASLLVYEFRIWRAASPRCRCSIAPIEREEEIGSALLSSVLA